MEFAINLGRASLVGSELDKAKNKISIYYDSVQNAMSRCSLDGDARESLRGALRSVLTDIKGEGNFLDGMKRGLDQAVAIYRSAEQKAAKCLPGGAKVRWGSSVGAPRLSESQRFTGTDASGSAFAWKSTDWWKLAGSFGIIGNGVSAIGNLATEGWNTGSVLSSAKYVSKVIGGSAAAVSKGGSFAAWGRQMTGFYNDLSELNTSSAGDTFRSSLKKQFGSDLSFSGAKTTAQKVKVGAKWAGHVLTVATNAWENYNEMQEEGISAGRAVAETVLESATDIAVGAAATAASAAIAGAAAAAAPVLAPLAGSAVVVAAGAVGIAWAANGICKWVTKKLTGKEKDLGETVADSVLSIGEGAVNLVKSAGKAISAKWKSIFG